MFLDSDTFASILESTPLVSLDFIVENEIGEILLGERNNRPAKGFWFVPGGRILKNESLASAFKRLTLNELGTGFSIEKAKLVGPYDHFYNDSVFGESPSTHYVAIAYRIKVLNLPSLPLVQHSSYRWFNIDQLVTSECVHLNTKTYFLNKE